jgi:hydroxymethylglutaryl-CoA lyase
VEPKIQAREEGYGPDRILFMVSTCVSHHKKNSGLSLAEYWKIYEEFIPKVQGAGMKVCWTVSSSECVHTGRIPKSPTGRK